MLNPFFNIRIADIIDILFVATMFYTASVWVKRTPAAVIVRGLVGVGGDGRGRDLVRPAAEDVFR